MTCQQNKIEWKSERRKISQLRANTKNPRSLSRDQAGHLQRSLQKFGLCEPIVINPDGLIIGGHQRVKMLKSLGEKQCEVFVPNRPLDQRDVEELTIRLNKNTGEWDFDVLANQWNPSDLIEWGFTVDELECDINVIDEKEADDEVLEPPKNPRTKLGDLYELESHRLLCGDATSREDIGKVLIDNSILMVTDPPYGVNHDPSWRDDYCIGKRGFSDKHKNSKGLVKNDHQIDWSLAYGLFPGNIVYIWHAGKFTSQVASHLEVCGFDIINQIIWAKQHFSFGRGDYHWKHEPCWYAVRKGTPHNWQGDRKQNTLWEIESLNPVGATGSEREEKTGHSTQKPLECMRRPIKNNSKEGEGVYDPFAGSGTTLLACEELKRKAYCIEIEPAYCDIIVTRWVKYLNKLGREGKVICNGKEIAWEIPNGS